MGSDDYDHGIVKGYASGNLSFTANVWDGSYNAGEFSIAGSALTPNDAAVKTYTLGGQRIATRQTGTRFYVHTDHGFADEAPASQTKLGLRQPDDRRQRWRGERNATA